LSNVSRPRVGGQGAQGRVVDAPALADDLPGRQEVPDQLGDVLAPVLQRRDINGEHVQAVEEILPKPPRPQFLLQRLVRRGDDANVGEALLDRPDPAVAAVFQHAQQFRLHRRGHLGDLVDEQGSALRRLE
jgi:hypothetical protein